MSISDNVCKAQSSFYHMKSIINLLSHSLHFSNHIPRNPNNNNNHHSMSSSKELPPHPFLTAPTITYKFVWESCFDEDPKPPVPDSHILITRLPKEPESEPDTDPSQTSTLSSPPTTDPTSFSPKTRTITEARDNGHEYIPCTAVLTWRHYVATFYGLFNDYTSKFSDWITDEEGTNQAFLSEWEGSVVSIGHTMRSGFHGGIWSGTPVLDDGGKRMLFVWVDSGLGWGIKLYGKVVGEEEVGGLSGGERERLRFDREGGLGGKRGGV